MSYSGILALDVSWKGMGCAAYAGDALVWAKCYDIRGNVKRFDMPIHTVTSVSKWVNEQLLVDCPWLVLMIDRVVIEAQFHKKMKYLQLITASAIMTVIKGAKMHFISALCCKRRFNVPLQKSHNENKKVMLKYVKDNSEKLLVGTLHQDNDNLADAIILLNTFHSSRKKNNFAIMSDYQIPGECPSCNQGTVYVNTVKKEGKNQGRQFSSCRNNCEGVFKWLDTPKQKHKTVSTLPRAGAKRSFESVIQENNEVLLKKMKLMIETFIEERERRFDDDDEIPESQFE
jgi:hypothetical protein